VAEPPPADRPFDRRDLLRITGLLAVLAVISVVAAVASGGGSGGDDGPKRAEVVGVITTVTADRLVLRPADGGEEMQFAVRTSDARRLDIFHLETHSAQGLPTRITYERDGGTLYAVSAIDEVPTG
jgi:hypothetical protein